MNNFLPIKRNHRAASRRGAARIISIMILAFLWPVRGGAQEQTTGLDVSNITSATTLTYKKKSDPDTYAWYYKIGTEGTDTEFSGTLTGSEKNNCPVITIKSEKEATSPDYTGCATLLLNGVSLMAADSADLINIAEGTKPLCIKTTGNSSSTLKGKNTNKNRSTLSNAIYNKSGGLLILDGEAGKLNILGEGDYTVGIRMYNNSGRTVSTILKNEVTIKAGRMGVWFNNAGNLSAIGDAKVKISSKCSASSEWSGEKAIGYAGSKVQSPFLQWTFDSAPETGKTLEIKNSNGQSFSPTIQFTTDGEAKSFAVNVTKNTGYTLWLGDKQLMDKNGVTVFTATDDKLFDFSGMQTIPPADWPDYAQFADVGADGTDIAISGSNYTVKTPCGLAWIAWVTNEGKTKGGNTGEAYTDYYPASSGFKDCTVTLASDISLATPAQGVASDFKNNWMPIGTYSYTSANDYTKCFQGTFYGNGKTITGMTISSATVEHIGLFGFLDGATVKNLTMADGEGSNNINLATITAGANTYPLGSIVGYVKNGKIINCHNRCAVSFSVSGKGGEVGGIVGAINESVLSACSNSGSINIQGSSGYGGGIVGVSTKSSIASCFNTAKIDVTAGSHAAYAGGIMGDDGGSGAGNNILHCYSTGNITAKATQSCTSGGIAGGAQYVAIKSCFATGAVSAESSDNSNAAYAGGIIGWIWSGGSVTIENCLALNTDGVKATGTTSNKYAGRIVGMDNSATLSNNYASTKIKLTVGDNTAAPTENIAADAVNGADLYLDKAAEVTASWAGSENTKAFTALDTEENGMLPQLKTVASYDANDKPATYGDAIEGQPALKSVDYLAITDLFLPANEGATITLSCSEGKWSYQKGDNETSTCFSGTVKMAQDGATSTNKLVIATVTGNPTLTFEKVEIKPTDGAALTINADCVLTINTANEGTSTLISSAASTLVNKGSLTLTGKGLYIGNTGDNNEYYGLDNSGSFTVTDPSSTSVTFHCANTAIHNTGNGKLANAWMEWRFAEASGGDSKIAFAATDDDNQSPAAQLRQSKTFATTVTAGKTYRLWKVTSNGSEVRTSQKGLDSNGKPVKFFSAVANAVSVYTEVEDLKTIEITESKDFSNASCAAQNVVVKSSVVLTVDAVDAFVFNLSLESGAQLVTTNPLKVFDTFLTTRTLENKWTTFGSPVALSVSVEEGENQLLYAATGYTGMDASSQSWNNISGTTAEGTNTAALAADSPYLLAAENTSTTVTFAATASADQAIEIPATIPVTLGDALEDGTFLFQTNPNLADLTLSNIYVLNADGKHFELKEGEYVVKPFEAFIVANAVTRARVASLKIGEGIATGIEQPLAAVTARVWGTRGSLHVYSGESATLTVVRSDGRVVYAASIAPGDTRLDLPSGIYMIRINNITYKIAL
ncbi:hypothetical protein [Parabacteroides goldsteinii]|uniref:hypothetical protein n=1 Tax=Parabacteroides goldsteinii TaxID=328812 RepID=UPI001E104E5B|nr:hypothetical protein [Parabacteroides goldsteinii]MBS6575653.1 hypothetical protein [Parabacteroides goldsteinii]